MAQVGRISGPLLTENLLRKGTVQPSSQANLRFLKDNDSDVLLKIDVNNGKIGVDVESPVNELQISNTLRTTNLKADTTNFANYTLSASNIDVDTGEIYLAAGEHIQLSNLETSDFYVSDNFILTKDTNANIELFPGTDPGTSTEIQSSLNVFGNLYTPGTLEFGGTITFGDQTTQDTVQINSDILSDIIPDQNELYALASPTKRWNELYTQLINGQTIETSTAVIATLDLALRSGNIFYVSVNGNDSNVGDHAQGPFRTIRRALEAADASVAGPVAIKIFPGIYEEQLPLVVPTNVSVIGEGIRSVTIVPASGNEDKDVFYLNGETTIQNLTIKDFQYNSTNNTGHAFRFAPNAVISTRSPYIQNVTVKTEEVPGELSPADIYVDPEGLGLSYSSNSVTVTQSGHSEALVQSWIGKTLVTYFGDGYEPGFYTVTGYIDEPQDPGVLWQIQLAEPFDTNQQAWLFSIYPNNGETIIVGSESVALAYDFSVSFNKSSLPTNFATTVGANWTMQIGEGVKIVDYVAEDPLDSTKWRVYLTSTASYTFGPPIFASPTASGPLTPAGRGAYINGAEMNPVSFDASMLFHSCTFITPNADAITMTNGVRVEWLNSFTYFANRGLYAVDGLTGRTSQDGSTTIYGAELRSIGSANVYGNYGAVADGPGTLMYLIKHNFGYIGSGLDLSNDPTLAIQENEVVQLNGGKIYYQSTDHLGTFRVGDTFFVNSEEGTTNINIDALTADALTGLIIKTGNNETILSGSKIETGNVRFTDNRVDSLSGDLNISSATETNILDNTTVNGNTYIRDNFTFDGTLNLSGNESTDRLVFNVEFQQDFNPNQHLTFDLGSEQKKWLSAELTQLEVGNFSIYNNIVETTESNANLELRANGSGLVIVPANDVEINNNLSVSGQTTLGSYTISGNIAHTGNRGQTGNNLLSGNLVVDDILIQGNYITTTSSNSNLELRGFSTTDIVLDGESSLSFGIGYDGGSANTVFFEEILEGGDSQGIVGFDGRVYIPNNDVRIDNDLIIEGNIETQDIVVTGTLTLSGNRTQTGSLTQIGSIDLNGFITVDNNVEISDISIVENAISTIDSNADLELRASGVGEIKFQYGNLILGNNLTVRDVSTNNIDSVDSVTFNFANISDIVLTQNYLNSTVGDLILEASGTGKIIILSSVEITNDLTINDTLTFKNSFIDQGYGPEIIRNGTFNTALTNWNVAGGGSASVSNSSLLIQAPIGVAQVVSQSNTVKPNTKYKFEADLNSFSLAAPTGEISLRAFQSGVGDLLLRNTVDIQLLGAPGKVVGTFFTGAPTTLTVALRVAGATVSWDNISLVEDLGLIEFINPLDLSITGNLTQTGNTTKTGNTTLNGNLTVNGDLNISDRTDFENYYIDNNVLANKRNGLSVLRTDAFNQFGFYSIVVAMSAGATADDYTNQTEKNLVNFLANGTSVNDDYGFSYIDVNQSGTTTTADSLAWLQFVANGTSGNPQTDAFIQNAVDQIIDIEFNNPGTFNKDALFFGDYFEPDVVLKASGSGVINFSRRDVRVEQDLFASSIISKDIIIDDIINLNEIIITDSIVEIDDNFISTSVSNANLELRSTKDIKINDSLALNNDLAVNQSTNLKITAINGLLTHAGNKVQTGNLNLTGNLSLRSLIANSQIELNDVYFNDNIIGTSDSNSNLELIAAGSGKIYLSDNDLRIEQNLEIGSLAVANFSVQNSLQSNETTFSDNIKIFDNVITTTQTNSPLDIRATGSILLDNIEITNDRIRTIQELTISAPLIKVDSTAAIKLPIGTTAQRPLANGSLRFNTNDFIFEGYGSNKVFSLGGIFSENRKTSIIPNSLDNSIRFNVNSSEIGKIDDVGLTINAVQVEDILINANTIKTTTSNSNLEFVSSGTGEIVIDSLSIKGNTIKNNSPGAFTLTAQNFGAVKFRGAATVIPYGTSAERPVNPERGTTRWNTEENILEVWDGSTFISSGGVAEVISASEFQDLMLEYTLIFG